MLANSGTTLPSKEFCKPMDFFKLNEFINGLKEMKSEYVLFFLLIVFFIFYNDLL